MLRSRASRSTIRAGVSIKVRDVFMGIPRFDALPVLAHSDACSPFARAMRRAGCLPLIRPEARFHGEPMFLVFDLFPSNWSQFSAFPVKPVIFAEDRSHDAPITVRDRGYSLG